MAVSEEAREITEMTTEEAVQAPIVEDALKGTGM